MPTSTGKHFQQKPLEDDEDKQEVTESLATGKEISKDAAGMTV